MTLINKLRDFDKSGINDNTPVTIGWGGTGYGINTGEGTFNLTDFYDREKLVVAYRKLLYERD